MVNQVSAIINPVTREILFEQSGVSAVELDGGLWTMVFKMPEWFGQNYVMPFSPSNYQVTVNYSQNNPELYNDGYTDHIQTIEWVEDPSWPREEGAGHLVPGYYKMLWTPPAEATSNQGWLYFNIRIKDTYHENGGTWSTKTKKVRVNSIVSGGNNPDLTPTQSDKITELLAQTELLLAAVAGDIDVSGMNTYLLAAHPIGSYYWSDEATDPGRLFGGTWEEVTDVFLFAAARDNQVGYQAGDSGGSKTHTLTVDEMPSHTHRLGIDNPNGEQLGGSKLQHLYNPNAIFYGLDDVIKTAGGGQAHNNMPPYYATYCWRRIA